MFTTNNQNFLSAKDIKKYTLSSSVVSAEIGYIYEILNKNIKDTNRCKDNCITIDNGTPLTYTSSILDVRLLCGGQGYHPVIPSASISGAGSGAILELFVNGGVIQNVIVVNGGNGYGQDTTITINNTLGTGAQFNIGLSGTSIGVVEVTDGGDGYFPLYPTITVESEKGNSANFLIGINLEDGSLKNIRLISGGYNYDENDTIMIQPATFSDGGGAVIDFRLSKPPHKKIDATSYYEHLSTGNNSCVSAHHIQQVKNEFIKKGFKIEALPNHKSQSSIIWKICW